MDYTAFRAEKDHFFKHDRYSPLTPRQRREFSGLDYFPPNPDLRLIVNVEPDPEQPEVVIQTSTGDQQVYRRYGTFTFSVEGGKNRLTVFVNEHGFFLPFVDSQAGKETYGAGRYLEPEQLEDGRLLVDFNLAYNPYCAYNENWSCPLTPWENRLKVPIRAGEKNFPGHPETG
jgi:uncharacterized protein (DUF1684 family)